MMFVYDLDKTFWEATVGELQQGYAERDYGFVCLICGETFTRGRVYPFEDGFYEAEKYTQIHVISEHGSMLEYLVSFEKKLTGLTDHQKQVISYFSEGKSDAEIATLLGTSTATIRGHRFSLREKAKQAKLLLAVTELMEASGTHMPPFVDIHRTARMVDERYMMTEQENQKILNTYFPHGVDGPLKEFPRKEKRKLAILRQIATRFKPGQNYTEAEVNEVLMTAYTDYVTLRRYLIEYGFLDRQTDGSAYWVKEK